jgi:hypothetical protein
LDYTPNLGNFSNLKPGGMPLVFQNWCLKEV